MPNILIYNSTTKRIQTYLRSVDEQEYLSRVGIDVIIQPKLPNCEQKYWLVENNKDIREMTQEEKDAYIIENAPNPTFEEKLNDLTKNGYYDEILKVRIKGTNTEMTQRWSPATTSILNMKSLGIPGNTPFQFIDFYESTHVVTFDEFQGLMARFAVWFNTNFFVASQK